MRKPLILTAVALATLTAAGASATLNFWGAAPAESSLALSPTATVKWPVNLGVRVTFLKSMGSFWLEGKSEKMPFTSWISRRAPVTFVNPFTVERVWNEELENLAKAGEKHRDLGCRQLSSLVYRCESVNVPSGDGYVAQVMIWSAKEDLVVVRVTSEVSSESAVNAIDKLTVEVGGKP